jgi:hypothetical protein
MIKEGEREERGKREGRGKKEKILGEGGKRRREGRRKEGKNGKRRMECRSIKEGEKKEKI